jgi:phosphohistidine phosphatase
MKLYLVQHGLSLPEEQDPQKPLSREGKKQTLKIADFLKKRKIAVDCLWHSTKLRAIQTAQIISKSIKCSEIQERDDLNPLDPVDKFPEKIESLNKDLMIVGHLPFLQKLVSLLLSGAETNEFVAFENSGVICLEYAGVWKIAWMITPELIASRRPG